MRDLIKRNNNSLLKTAIILIFSLCLIYYFYILMFPSKKFLGYFWWSLFYPFEKNKNINIITLVLIFICGSICLYLFQNLLLNTKINQLISILLIIIFGVILKFSIILSFDNGFNRYRYRFLTTGHTEFFVEAIKIDDLKETILNYESFLNKKTDRPFIKSKGQGCLLFYFLLIKASNINIFRKLFFPFVFNLEYSSNFMHLLQERAYKVNRLYEDYYLIPQEKKIKLAYAITFSSFIFPILTYSTLIPLYFLTKLLTDEKKAVIICSLYLFIPEITLMTAHLDFNLYPFLFCSSIALFLYGNKTNNFTYTFLSCLLFILHLTITLAGLITLQFIFTLLLLDFKNKLLQRKSYNSVLLNTSKTLIFFLIFSVLILVLLYFSINFNPIERYSNAREIQANWIKWGSNIFWYGTNFLEYFLSFSFGFLSLYILQLIISIYRFNKKNCSQLDLMIINWAITLILLNILGKQHGETNRLWAFMSCLGCIGVGEIISNFFQKWLFVLYVVFLFTLLVSRYYLNIF